MRFEEGTKLDFADVLIRPKRSTLRSREAVDLVREYQFKNSGKSWRGIPVIAANMDHTGTFGMAKILGEQNLMTALAKFQPVSEWEKQMKAMPESMRHTFASAGSGEKDFALLKEVMALGATDLICLDVANGYSQQFLETVSRTREAFPDKVIMAGNVVTGEMVEALILAGADIVKIGIGPGSVCTTRSITGVGYPQLSATIECADAAHGLNGHVCTDGGCVVVGDVAKAFAAGADFVMLGGMFAGHDECEGELIEKDGRKHKRFYGMSSAEAMERHGGAVKDYRASEGKSVSVPYKGPVKKTIKEILGGLRSTCTYVGASRLKELSKCTTFVKVQRQLNEVFSGYHDG